MRDNKSDRLTQAAKNDAAPVIIGRSCRLPGANSPDALWDLLSAGRCAVSRIPSDRWSLERLGHPRERERGRSYTWSAGVLDDPWGFDPAVFGISPREAEQMDPQQRLLLELCFEAIEDAGIAPSTLAGTQTGVFIGGSSLDYGNLRLHDPAAADAYFATGNTLAVLSNRISYVFDLRGPSFTIDTACSSSLVALDAAVAAIRSGAIDTAIVGGANMLVSPFGFISFSQAAMLSPTGLCRAFSADADGYVRAEGGVVLVLRAQDLARANGDRVHAVIAASAVNSDGRTNGISLPSALSQSALLEQIYGQSDVDPDDIAFVEAHGTGTRVGDPVEAESIGRVLGRRRRSPLPIGSIKTNIGHIEPASGLAGAMKAMLALEHDEFPRSLHCGELNPDIPFDDLNLSVSARPAALAKTGRIRYAGVSSFGFGGTNAHVVLADPPACAARRMSSDSVRPPQFLMLSAQSETALAELARSYSARLKGADPVSFQRIVAATGRRRESHSERLVIPVESPRAMVQALDKAARQGSAAPTLAVATAIARDAPVAFVFSGNGSQWPGMGQHAYETNAGFRARFDAIDALFQPLAGWSLALMMFDPDIAMKLGRTSIAQPLVFAIQAATAHCLLALGLRPAMALGHSMGEVAAAEAAGALDLESAVRVIHYRSLRQELVRDAGGLAVAFGSRETVEALVAGIPDLVIAAHNSPRNFTVSGPLAALDELARESRAARARVRRLDLAYPFHSELMQPVAAPLHADLAGLAPKSSRIPFISTVAPGVLSGPELGAVYWWRNVREPVLFMEGIEQAVRLGARVFVKIGPGGTLVADIRETAENAGASIAAFPVHHQKPTGEDPFRRAVAEALAHGGAVDKTIAFGDDPGVVDGLPAYPWQRKSYRVGETPETSGLLSVCPWHPLIGARLSADSLEWHGQIDPLLVPALADHRIDGQILLPGAAFAEMALAVAADWLGAATAAIENLEIHQPMIFAANATRQSLCRVTPTTGTIEILSRPRLSNTPFVLHAKAKAIQKPGRTPGAAMPKARDKTISGAALYAEALRSGLEFGPAFRQAASAARSGKTSIIVNLKVAAADPRYGLDPARLDSCFHGLILIFADLTRASHAPAYLPVRFGEIRLERPGAAIAQAHIEIKRCDARAIVADFTLVDADGELIARLRDARYQALRAPQHGSLAVHSVVQSLPLAEEPTATRRDPSLRPDLLTRAAKPETAMAAARSLPADLVLIEGWAAAAAYRLASTLAASGRIAPDELIAAGRFPPARRDWLANLLKALADSGLAEAEGAAYNLAQDLDLPDPDEILQTFAADHPRQSAELLLAAGAGAAMEALSRGEAAPAPSESAIESFELGSLAVVAAANLLADLLKRLSDDWPRDRALRILQIGHGPLSSHAVELALRHGGRLTIFEPDQGRLQRARLAFARDVRVVFLDSLDSAPDRGFDLVVAADALHRIAPTKAILARIVELMASEGLIAAIEPETSLFRDLVFGLDDRRLAGAGQTGSVPTIREWSGRTASAGLRAYGADPIMTTAGRAILVSGQKPKATTKRSVPATALIVSDGDLQTGEIAAALAARLIAAGVECAIEQAGALDRSQPFEAIVFLCGLARSGQSSVDHLAARCLSLKTFAESLGRQAGIGKQKARLWIATHGALSASDEASPVEAGFWAFARSFANEFQGLSVRRVDIAPGLPPAIEAERLAGLIASGTTESDIVVDQRSTRVVRLHAQDRGHAPDHWAPAAASRLEKGEGAGLDRIRWTPIDRTPPGPGKIEIAVAASGLNFRDVMWGLSVLPDELLEDGFAGPTLGLECAGHVAAIGQGVTGFKLGDAVVAFAGGALASHVTVDANLAAMVPAGLSLEAATTIPVAFLTAYYALMGCARLAPGEWVLIHGGAGAVGLAALQIARWRGARVIASAGSVEKRDLVRTLGAEHVFDGRSGNFVDEVRRVSGAGVAVVLNSLSGEAMERSIGLLEPFGRFIELGKRDYLANTHIGLRPFRKNLSYFGVDLDHLILAQAEKGHRLFEEVMGLIAEGEFSALPYRSFPASEFIDAMRLMQQSGHIGKIVITPPKAGAIRIPPQSRFAVAPDKTHLITGGFGGFGLEAARWLVERGARHLALVGRSGANTPEARQTLADFKAAGVKVHVAARDISNGWEAKALVQTIAKEMAPLGGVIHAAMVLDDALIVNLEAQQLRKVLAPKVAGAEHLDRLTRGVALDYFVLFSSATTVIGNPGQGAYVAANGFLEGLARQRRAAGLPALAVAWGGIEDVGLLARNHSLKDTLASRAGVKGMSARRALDLMSEALSRSSAGEDDAMLVIAEIDWATARTHLPLLSSPTYAELIREDEAAEADKREKIDVAALLLTRAPEDVRKTIVEVIVEEIAHILRLPLETLNRSKPLSEIGLDSLMAVELGVSLEERLSLEAPLSTSAGGFNVGELADHIIGSCVHATSEGSAIAKNLAEKHLGKAIAANMAPLTAIVEDKSRDLTQILR
ncbi:Beta-ketoacyl synthase [Methylocella silvestris BL2]|uniref:Beta-ketoacyl synthase n=1 Tax=Methylocella silvestris (strain DSM 15510 / CIP 108128 / LMG 27833 / NCIMB 13906 / BL2) TaxID=395965 RepID=B8ERU7_METSB|nr:type I polyketide synthase [Methylocella silvestris]ACK51645.1 Beta-ketoacyl synthase [Methylocella silvestris BL2]